MISGPRRRVYSVAGNSRAAGIAPGKPRAGDNRSQASDRNSQPSYSYATHVAVVEIDPETGQPQDSALHRRARLRKNREPSVGRRANRRRSGSGHRRGIARTAWSTIPDGHLQTQAMMDYVLPGASDVPADFRLWHMETPTSFNPFGMRGVGEGGSIGAHAAMANAVADACAITMLPVDGSGPFTPTWIMEALSRPLRAAPPKRFSLQANKVEQRRKLGLRRRRFAHRGEAIRVFQMLVRLFLQIFRE